MLLTKYGQALALVDNICTPVTTKWGLPAVIYFSQTYLKKNITSESYLSTLFAIFMHFASPTNRCIFFKYTKLQFYTFRWSFLLPSKITNVIHALVLCLQIESSRFSCFHYQVPSHKHLGRLTSLTGAKLGIDKQQIEYFGSQPSQRLGNYA